MPGSSPWKAALLSVIAALAPASPMAGPTVAEWRADLAFVASAVRDTHPAPFHTLSEDEFADRIRRLEAELPDLDGRQVVVRLAELLAALGDAHTRLMLPLRNPELALQLGHGSTPPVHHEDLKLDHLPFEAEAFAEGIFVVRATGGRRDLLGARVVGVGEHTVDEALQRLCAASSPPTTRWGPACWSPTA